MSGRRWAPLLLGALVASLVAARLETVLLAVAVAGGVAIALRAPPPPRAWVFGTLTAGGIAVALNFVLVPGRPLGPAGPFGLTPTVEGLARGVLLALRIVGAAVAVHGLRAAWPAESAADEIARLLRPLERVRFPLREARAMLWLALRFAPLLASEVRRIARLQELRAGRPARGTRERLARARAVGVPALVASLEHAERVALALEARHYRMRPIGGLPLSRSATVAGVALAGVSLLWRG